MTREGLIRAGVDYDNGVRRFAGKQQTYEKYLMKFFDKDPLLDLERQLEAGDYETAFRTAHSLKGVSGNLGMIRLYDEMCELTGLLRAGGQCEGAALLCERAMEFYDQAKEATRE